MGEYSKYISEKRREVPTPKDLVKDGQCVFGTFDKEFETMDLISANKPTCAPNSMNKQKLTLWEASEVHLKEGILLAVVTDMSLFGMTMNIFYDYRTKKVYDWSTNLKSKDTIIAPNLLRGSVAEGVTPVSHVKYVNSFELGKAHLEGHHQNDKDTIEYSFELENVSKPCIVSIPFGKNRPLYSEKVFFKATGSLILNGEKLTTDEDSYAVIDDHRGFYPRKMHYDWLATMGRIEHDGKMIPFSFNLTRNQSIDQEDYNENLIFLEGKTSILPPVTFTSDTPIKDFKKTGIHNVHVKDEHGMVDIDFKVEAIRPMITHALVVMIDYYVLYGKINGFVLDEDGNKYEFKDVDAIGEDKTMLF